PSSRARMPAFRHNLRHWSFRSVILTFLCVLVALLACAIGWVGYGRIKDALTEASNDRFRLANLAIGEKTLKFFLDGEKILDELVPQGSVGVLPFDDYWALGIRLASRLELEPGMEWLSYSDAATGRF